MKCSDVRYTIRYNNMLIHCDRIVLSAYNDEDKESCLAFLVDDKIVCCTHKNRYKLVFKDYKYNSYWFDLIEQ